MKAKEILNRLLRTSVAVFCGTVLISSTGTSVWAATENILTLDGAIKEALSANPEIKRLRLETDFTRYRFHEAISGFLPDLSASANHLLTERFQVLDVNLGGAEAEFPLIQPYTQLDLRASIALFNGFRNVNALKIASLGREIAELNLSRKTLEVEVNVGLAFDEALAAQLLVEVAEQNLKMLEEHLAEAKSRVHSGIGTRFDVLRVEVQLSEARPELLQARDDVVLTRMRLAQLLGKTEETRTLKGSLPEEMKESLPETLPLSPLDREDYQALRKSQQIASRERAIAKSHWLPDLNFYVVNQWYNNVDHAIVDTDPYRRAYNVGVSLRWSLFDGGASIARTRQAAIREAQAEVRGQALLIQMPYEVEKWKRKYLMSVALVEARTAAIASAEEAVRLAHAGQSAGIRTATDVLDAELDLARARAGAVRARLGALTAFRKLELALGHRIDS